MEKNLEKIINHSQTIQSSYTAAKEKKQKKENPERLKLIHLITLVCDFIATKKNHEKEDLDICRGIYLLAIKQIGPLKTSRFFERSNDLLTILLKGVDIKSIDQVNEKAQLLYLEKLYAFLNCNKLKPELLDQHNIKITLVKKQLLQHISNLWKPCLDNIKTDLLTAVQKISKGQLDLEKMSHLFDNYAKNKTRVNKDKMFYAQLAQCIATAHKSSLSHIEDVRRGALLLIINFYRSEWFGDDLITFAYDALSIKDLNEMDHASQLKQINALRNYLRDNNNIDTLEVFAQNQFSADKNYLKDIYLHLTEIDSKLDEIGKELSKKGGQPVSYALSTLGAFVGGFVTYGTGAVAGSALSQFNESLASKMMVNRFLQYLGPSCLGAAGGPMALMVADLLVASILSRGFAKAFEQIGILLGSSTGEWIGRPLDWSYNGLREACKSFFDLYHNTKNSEQLAGIDFDIMECLHYLPEEIVSEDKRLSIEGEINADIHRIHSYQPNYTLGMRV